MSTRQMLAALTAAAAVVASFGVGGFSEVAAVSATTTSETTFPSWCGGRVGWPQSGPTYGFDVTAPVEVDHGEAFTVRVAPRPDRFANQSFNAIVGVVSVFGRRDVTWSFQASPDAVVESATVVPGTGFGSVGTPTASVEVAEGAPAVASVTVPEVPVDPDSPTGETAYQVPAVDLVLRAIGPVGSDAWIRVAGGLGSSTGHRFTVLSTVGEGHTTCGARSSTGPSPVRPPAMSSTVVATGPSSVPTTTRLDVAPTLVVVGEAVELLARVDSPTGTVRFEDDGELVDEVGVDADGIARLVAPLELLGDRSLTARFLGGGGYEPSASAPVVVHVVPHKETTTELAVAPSRLVVGQVAELTAVVRATHGGPVRDGSVAFSSGGIVLGHGAVGDDGSAVLETTRLRRGETAVQATYRGGAAGFSGSTGALDVFVLGDSFSDVGPDHPFADDVDWMEREGLTQGYPDGTFRPAGVVTRQAMAVFLHRQAGGPLGPGGGCPGGFVDVRTDQPFCWDITWLQGFDAVEGIELGYPDGTFRPTLAVSRQAAAAFLYRQAGAPDGADPACEAAAFPDVPVAHPFCGEIAWMVGAGLAEGYPDGTFGPAHPVTRQATAAFLHRAAG